MLGVDRPVGRLLDELAFEENWMTSQGSGQLPILVLHGSGDLEVPASQAAVWKERLPRHPISVVTGKDLDHRFMRPGEYNIATLMGEIVPWLDGLFPEQGCRYVWPARGVCQNSR